KGVARPSPERPSPGSRPADRGRSPPREGLDHGQMSRTTQAAVCPVDRRSGAGIDPPPSGQAPRAIDGAALSAEMGVHAAKAAVARHATLGRGDPALAGAAISEDRPSREAREGADLLG